MKAGSAHTRAVFSVCLFLVVSFLHSPVRANVLPESAFLVNVQPVSGNGCMTEITDCSQIVRTTQMDGLLEFQLFFYPLAWEDDHYPIERVVTDLTWPEAWQLVSVAACGNPSDASLTHDGLIHHLDLEWSDCPPITGQMFLVASFIMNVQGPGRFDFIGDPYYDVTLRCQDESFVAHTVGIDAEAGMDCEFTTQDCANGEYCRPSFEVPELELAAPQGGMARGETRVCSMNGAMHMCDLIIDTRAPWASAVVIPEGDHSYCGSLRVTASAAGLEPGQYETRMQVYAPAMEVARCLSVRFLVWANTGVPDDAPPAVQEASWGRLKAIYR